MCVLVLNCSDSAVCSGDSFIPFFVWGLFNSGRRLPKTYKPPPKLDKPPLKTDKAPLEPDKPPPETNNPPLETDKPPPETRQTPTKNSQTLHCTLNDNYREEQVTQPLCQRIVFLLCSTFPLKFPLFPLNSHELPPKTTKFPLFGLFPLNSH